MKRKLSPEDLRLWQSQVQDIKPLPRTRKEPEDPAYPKVPQPRQRRALKRDLDKPLPLSPPQSFGRKDLRCLQIEARLDLHGMTLEKGYQTLERFLLGAQDRGFKTVLVITGKGSLTAENTLRRHLPQWLEATHLRHLVSSLHHPAKLQDGGAGAFYVGIRRWA
jgi:DNA-nicking Smr family endonuclease